MQTTEPISKIINEKKDKALYTISLIREEKFNKY